MSGDKLIHNGEIIAAPAEVQTEVMPAQRPIPDSVEDTDPEMLAGLIACCISTAMAETPMPPPMEVVNRLLRLKTPMGRKALWTRFDMLQLYSLYSNKLERQRYARQV